MDYGPGGPSMVHGMHFKTVRWWIHFDIWQNQSNIVKLKKKKTVRVLGNVGSDERHSRLEGDWGEGGADGYLSLLPGGGDLRHCSL